MSRLLLASAVAALIAGTNFVSAQTAGDAAGAVTSSDAPAGSMDNSGGTVRGGAEDRAAPAVNSVPDKRDEATDTTNTSDQKQPAVKQSEPDDKVERDNGKRRATD